MLVSCASFKYLTIYLKTAIFTTDDYGIFYL